MFGKDSLFPATVTFLIGVTFVSSVFWVDIVKFCWWLRTFASPIFRAEMCLMRNRLDYVSQVPS
jgi:hypothetical protein